MVGLYGTWCSFLEVKVFVIWVSFLNSKNLLRGVVVLFIYLAETKICNKFKKTDNSSYTAVWLQLSLRILEHAQVEVEKGQWRCSDQ